MTFVTPMLRAAGRVLSPGGRRGKLTILTYHRVLPEHDPVLDFEQVDVKKFAAHMRAVASCFNVLPLPEAMERMQAGTLPPRALAITFDDGYRDNYTEALPILQSLNLPATFFICTGYLDEGLMFNDVIVEALRRSHKSELDLSWIGLGVQPVVGMVSRRKLAARFLNAVKYLPFNEREQACARLWDIAHPGARLPTDLMMSQEQVRSMAAQGMTIGGHTHSHPILKQISLDAARADIITNRQHLQDLVGEAPRVFAYPNGRPQTDYQYDHVQLLRSVGFEGAVTTAWGVATRACDPYQLPRFAPWDQDAKRLVLRLLKNAVTGQHPLTVQPPQS